ncbi:carbohydrate binding family 9 domain-containing protein [Denitromonas iodatirespirans]|uniref:Carbohydrate binding family 9 domain-containing protein n=1 Tax=Denitromonas iodatirespirans TaxID=2795389 RepID=A0A944H701_DENI1|nr:carbohydrate binding family 9 domain-containing protein [Denitromonas iodatirespirans]MBT0960684.1 carbohydrate binding family 9 domain-containing protein [Denitromonas iodatirespirans]
MTIGYKYAAGGGRSGRTRSRSRLFHPGWRTVGGARWLLRAMLLWFAMAVAALPADAHDPAAAPLVVGLLPAGVAPLLDGRLDEPWWAEAALIDTFYEVDPGDRLPPPVRTEIRLAVDARYLYIGVRAFDPSPQAIRAPILRRDDSGDDADKVTIYIDALGNRRVAQIFEVSASGSIGDGLFSEDTGSADEGGATLGVEDMSPNFRYRSAAARFEGGWSAELAIPFSTLRYETGDAKSWGVLVARNYPREQAYYMMSGPVPRDSACTLCWATPLAGLQPPQYQLTLQGTASLSHRTVRERQADGGTAAQGQDQAGLDLKLSWRADTHADLTLRPDFSQVEIDAPQLAGNTRYAIYFPEKRQFFLESADLLESPLPVLRTRSLAAPDWGLRLTHRGPVEGTVLIVRDAPAGSILLPAPSYTDERLREQPSTALLMRMRTQLGDATIGALHSQRRYEGALGRNEVSGVDAAWSPAPSHRLDFQWLQSRSTALQAERGVPDTGSAWQLRWFHRAPSLSVDASVRRVDAGFRADNGFVERADVRQTAWSASIYQRPWFGLQEVGLTMGDQRSLALDGDRSLLDARTAAGAYATLPRLTRLAVEPWVRVQQRATTTGLVHEMQRWQANLSSMPSSWWSGLWLQIEGGEMLDVERDRIGRGGAFDSWARWQPHAHLQVQGEFRRLAIGGHGQAWFDERAWRLLVLWHLGPDQYLRWIDQRRRVRRQGLSDSGEAARTLSWQYRWRSDWLIDVGMTTQTSLRVNADRGARSRELFVKATWEFDR